MSYSITTIANNLLAQSTNPNVGYFHFNGVAQTGLGQQTRPVIYPTGSDSQETIPALLCVDWSSSLEVALEWEDGDPMWGWGMQLVGTCTLPIPGTDSIVKFVSGPWLLTSQKSVAVDVLPVSANGADLSYAFLCPPITSWQIEVNNTTIPLAVAPVLEVYFARQADIYSSPYFAMSSEQARFLVARDLAKPFLTTSTPTASESAAASTQGAFLAPPIYTDVPHYSIGNYGLELTDWLFALSGLNPSPLGADCSNSAAMCSLVLQLQQNPAVQQVWCGTINGQGLMNLKATVFRGGGMPLYSFGWHDVLLYISSGVTDVCDATVGPHIGNETPDNYVPNTFSNPPNVASPYQSGGFAWGEPPSSANSFRSFQSPTNVDGQPFPLPTSSSATLSSSSTALSAASDAARQSFAKRVNFVPQATESAPVSVSGLDPALACPSLAKLGLKFRRTSNDPVWRRYFVYADEAVQAHIKVWESADPAHAREIFLDAGASGEGRLPYTPDFKVGDASGFRKPDHSQDCIWLYRNITVRLTVIGDGVDAKDIAQSLQQALANA